MANEPTLGMGRLYPVPGTGVPDAQAFSSQTRRRPSSVSSGSTVSIVGECGATRRARPPVAMTLRLDAELPRSRSRGRRRGPRSRRRARLQRGPPCLADHPRGSANSTVASRAARAKSASIGSRCRGRARRRRTRRRARRRRSWSRCRSRRRCTGRRSARSAATALAIGRARPRAGRRSGWRSRCATPGPTTSTRRLRRAPRDASYSRMSGGTVEARQMPSTASSSSSREQRAELVAGARALGRDPPVLDQPLAVVEPDDGLRVADVEREQHRVAPALDASRRRREQRLSEPLGERLAVSDGSSPSARSSSTVTSRRCTPPPAG